MNRLEWTLYYIIQDPNVIMFFHWSVVTDSIPIIIGWNWQVHLQNQGNFLVAGRDLARGDLILDEDVSVVGPADHETRVCVGCYFPAHDYSCSFCQVPLCGPSCQKVEQFPADYTKLYISRRIQPVTEFNVCFAAL